MGGDGTEEGKGLGCLKLAYSLIVARPCLLSLGHSRRGAGLAAAGRGASAAGVTV